MLKKGIDNDSPKRGEKGKKKIRKSKLRTARLLSCGYAWHCFSERGSKFEQDSRSIEETSEKSQNVIIRDRNQDIPSKRLRSVIHEIQSVPIENSSNEKCCPESLHEIIDHEDSNNVHSLGSSLGKKNLTDTVIRNPLSKMKSTGLNLLKKKLKDEKSKLTTWSTLKPKSTSFSKLNPKTSNRSIVSDLTDQDTQDEETPKQRVQMAQNEENAVIVTKLGHEESIQRRHKMVSFNTFLSDSGKLQKIVSFDEDESGQFNRNASDEESSCCRRRRSGLSTGTLEQFLAMAGSQDDLLSDSAMFQDSLTDLEKWTKNERARDWLSSLCRLDPRWQIKTFFEECAQAGVADIEVKGIDIMALSPILLAFSRAQVFTVWRPTSIEAIRKMMTGEAVGKGLGIKGKSAKRGLLSGYVPFLQIHTNEDDKQKISTLPKNGRIRVFFKSIEIREKAVAELETVMDEMIKIVKTAQSKLHDNDQLSDEDCNAALENLRFEMAEPEIRIIDENSPQTFGVDIPERLFWEAFVMRKDITREDGSPMDTGRPSEPAFQDMNFTTTRKPKKYDPKAVVFQYGGHADEDPLCPLTLLIAYEDNGSVLPVASDFDGFLMGTKGVKYESPLPSDQVEVLQRTVDQIEEVLDDETTRDHSWTTNWLNVLKKNAVHGVKPNMPQYGYGDRKSYCIMENAIGRLRKNGAVRHGSECFNYFFPQELDKEFLVISGNFPDKVPWKYLNVGELQEYLMDQIDKGFTFPLNPKWILCDPGWAAVYDKLLSSQHPNVQNSLDAWIPPESGIREKIEMIRTNHPFGFVRNERRSFRFSITPGETHAMDLATLQLKRYLALQRAKRKLKIILYWIRISQKHSKSANEPDDEGNTIVEENNIDSENVPNNVVKENNVDLNEPSTVVKDNNFDSDIELSTVVEKNNSDDKRPLARSMPNSIIKVNGLDIERPLARSLPQCCIIK